QPRIAGAQRRRQAAGGARGGRGRGAGLLRLRSRSDGGDGRRGGACAVAGAWGAPRPPVRGGGGRAESGRPPGAALLRRHGAHAPGRLVVVAVEDLEEGERLKREVSRAREHLAKVLGSVADAILTLEADGRIESCNDAVERTLGFALEELRGSLVTELCSDPA